MFSSGLWSLMTIKSLQPKTNILALFKPQVTAKAAFSFVGPERLSVSVVNLDPANTRRQSPGQHVGVVFADHWQYC